MTDYALDDIERLAKAALIAHGAGDMQAGAVAHAIRIAEAKGNKICGLYYLQSYCQQLQTGRVDGQVDPIVTSPKAGAVHVDAKFGFAQPAFAVALPTAIAAVGELGIASLTVAHAHTCTSLGYFTQQIAQMGYIGIGFTNASAIVAPPGGNRAVLGTNPMAMAVPDGAGGVAFQFDHSTTTVALGKITMAKAAGEPIPLGWALDADGKPTDNPDAALQGGSLESAGGYKGWNYALMVEVLASALSGSVSSRDVKPLKAPGGPPHDLGQTYILIDPDVHNSGFHSAIAALRHNVDAQDGARLPGTGATVGNVDRVTLDDAIWAQLNDLAGG